MNLRKLKNQAGFTLVELIVVIAIMAILAGVAVPVYSGYIEKANKAADLQLLGAVNSAFGAAVIENGSAPQKLSGASATISGGKVAGVSASATGLDSAKVNESFGRYFAGNTDAKFKVITALVFDNTNGVFVDVNDFTLSEAFNKVLENLKNNPEALKLLQDSAFGAMGADSLLNQVDMTSNVAAALLNSNETLKALITNCGDVILETMGITDPAEAVAAIQGMTIEKMEQLKAENPAYAGIDTNALFTKIANGEELTDAEKELSSKAENAISTNNAILAAAKNSDAAADSIISILQTSDPKSKLVANVNSGISSKDTGESLAQVAMAYGLYTAYAQRNNIEVSSNPSDVLVALGEDTGFRDYINNKDGKGYAEQDLAGYKASMDMINSSVQGNPDAVSDVLVNGFNDPQLIAVLQQAMAK